MKEIQERIGQNIKTLRLNKQMSQKDLADKIGKSVPDISNIENGNVNLTLKSLYEICIAMDVVCDIRFLPL